MIAGNEKNGPGTAGPLWITGLSPVAAPSQLPTAAPSPTPQRRARGNQFTLELLNFHLLEMSDFRLPLTALSNCADRARKMANLKNCELRLRDERVFFVHGFAKGDPLAPRIRGGP